MEFYSTIGIVFKVVKYSETSIICDIYTKEKGLRSFIINGVRSSKSKSKSSLFQHMNILSLSAVNQDPDKLTRLKEHSLYIPFQKIPFEVLRSSLGIFTLELSKNSIKEREPNEELFEFLYEWYCYLDSSEICYALAHIKFMLELSKHLGFGPLNNWSENNNYFDLVAGKFINSLSSQNYLNDEVSLALSELVSTSFENLDSLKIKKSTRKQLIEGLLSYYELQLPTFKELKSYKVLEELLN